MLTGAEPPVFSLAVSTALSPQLREDDAPDGPRRPGLRATRARIRLESYAQASLLRARPVVHMRWRCPASSAWQRDRPIDQRSGALLLTVVANRLGHGFLVASAYAVNTGHYRQVPASSRSPRVYLISLWIL